MHTSPKCSVCSTSCKQGTRCLRGFQQRKWAWYFARHRTIFTNSNSAQLCRAHHCRFRRVQLSHSAKERHGGNCKTGSFMLWISCAFAHACERKAPAPQPEPRPRRQQPRQQDHKHFSGSILETDNADIADGFCAGKAKPAKETLALATRLGRCRVLFCSVAMTVTMQCLQSQNGTCDQWFSRFVKCQRRPRFPRSAVL